MTDEEKGAPAPTPQENARVSLLAGKLLPDAVKDIYSTPAAEADAALLAWMVETGSKSIEVKSEQGDLMGTISRTGGQSEAFVKDERVLLVWCEVEHPEEIETVKRVRPAFVGKLLKDAAENDEAVDVTTGQAVPGIEFRTKDYGLSRRPNRDAKSKLKTLVLGTNLVQLPGVKP